VTVVRQRFDALDKFTHHDAKSTLIPPKPMDPASQPSNVTIDGKEYSLDSLSAEAREQIARISAADRKLQELQVDFVLAQSARTAFVEKLKELLPH
jgi:hypothetical protein